MNINYFNYKPPSEKTKTRTHNKSNSVICSDYQEEGKAINEFLKQVRQNKRSYIFAEPHIKYEKSPFRQQKSPLVIRGIVKDRRVSVAAADYLSGHSSRRKNNTKLPTLESN